IQVTIDNYFLEKCMEIFKDDHVPKNSLEMMDIDFDQSFNKQSAEKLAQFLITLKLRKLQISYSNKLPDHIFDSAFLAQFSSSSNHTNYCFQYGPQVSKPQSFWSPDREFLHVLCRFKNFKLHRLILDATFLIELCLVTI
ncbi:hypothetical protein PFISCL1PPCAC_2612, partial [Pristionchus fissidentatus]